MDHEKNFLFDVRNAIFNGLLGGNLWSKFGPVISKNGHILQKCCDDYGNKKSQKTAKNCCALPCIIAVPMITNQPLYQLS